MFWHTSREKHGLRAWLHFGGDRVRSACIGVEIGWWHRFCHVGIECDDEGWNFSAALPPLFFHLSLEGFPIWQPRKPWTWNGKTTWLPDRRECRIAIHDWTIWIQLWSKWGEWAKSDPWWVRGVSFNLQDFALGRTRYTCEQLGDPIDVPIPMPEGQYMAVLTPRRQTWKRPRWFAQVRESYDINIPKGIPFAGKGENSWDCGDDGLFGMSAEGTVENAVERVRQTVLERRRRYGQPSEDSIQEALGAGVRA